MNFTTCHPLKLVQDEEQIRLEFCNLQQSCHHSWEHSNKKNTQSLKTEKKQTNKYSGQPGLRVNSIYLHQVLEEINQDILFKCT